MSLEVIIEPVLHREYRYITRYNIVAVRGDVRKVLSYTYMDNEAEAKFMRDDWDNFLNNGDNPPKKEDYNVDPTRVCHECDHHYTIYSNNIKCHCIPF